MRSDGEFEVRNRHGDVVQRGEIEATGVRAVETPVGTVQFVDVAFRDPVDLRRAGDAMVGHLHVEV